MAGTGMQTALGFRELPVGQGWEAACTRGGQRWWGVATSDGVGVLELSLRDQSGPHSALPSMFLPGARPASPHIPNEDCQTCYLQRSKIPWGKLKSTN